MEIKAHSKVYQVYFEENFGFLDELKKKEQALWVIDQRVYELYRDKLWENIGDTILIEAAESQKVIETVLKICEKMTTLPGKRNSTIISVGGGIIQDITGFAANILYRGVHWIYIPTTLLASCDSCIGSKTSLNYKHYKNLLGTFYPPDQIYECPMFFKTLSQIDYLSGLGEVVKFNIMVGKNELETIKKDMLNLLKRDDEVVGKYIHKSLEFKKGFIEKDEYDKGIRIKLNFAHTFGHAFETITEYAVPHGTAVAMGMIAADHISFLRGWMSAETVKKIQNILKQIINIRLLAQENHLKMDCFLDLDGILDAMAKDKKQVGNNITAVLFKNDQLELEVVHDLKKEEVQEGINSLLNVLKA